MKNSSLYEEGVIANQTTLLSGKCFSLMEELLNVNFVHNFPHTWYHKRIPKVNQSFAKNKKKKKI